MSATPYFGRGKYIYFPLANSRGEKNPVIYASGGRRYKLYQFLEEHVGLPALRQQIWQVIGIGSGARDRRQFDAAFCRAFFRGRAARTSMDFSKFR
jgi:hypothetical protein